MPFICECADPHCTKIIRVTTGEHEAVRANPVLFLTAPGHQRHAGVHAAVVSENDRYVISDKLGDAGRIAASLDPREDDADVA